MDPEIRNQYLVPEGELPKTREIPVCVTRVYPSQEEMDADKERLFLGRHIEDHMRYFIFELGNEYLAGFDTVYNEQFGVDTGFRLKEVSVGLIVDEEVTEEEAFAKKEEDRVKAARHLEKHNQDDCMDVYVIRSSSIYDTYYHPESESPYILGFANYPNNSSQNNVVMLAYPEDWKTLLHELGHAVSLCHTHDSEDCTGISDVELIEAKAEATGADASAFSEKDCYNSGDGLCDTPPDPGPDYCSTQTLDEGFITDYEYVGTCDEPYSQFGPELPVYNIMSYQSAFYQTFSPEGLAQMSCTYDLHKDKIWK